MEFSKPWPSFYFLKNKKMARALKIPLKVGAWSKK